ncbi:hypothetical protein Trydic_g16605 [Trypoxylus dichotomus]
MKKILTVLNVEDNFVSSFRLGKVDHTRERPGPIKVKLSSEDAVRLALKNVSKLKGHTSIVRVSRSHDRTPFERKLYRTLKAELLERNKGGEKDLRTKYIHGIPRIISSLN